MRSPLTAALLLVATALSFHGIAGAQERPEEALPYLLVGPVIVEPSLTLRETYRDNVLYSENDPQGDFVTAISPELRLRLPFRMHELTLGASADIETYADFSSEDTSAYRVDGAGNFTIGDRISVRAAGGYQKGFETPLESPNGTTDEYTVSEASLSLQYAFVDVSQLRLTYAKKTFDYPDSDFRSHDEGVLALRLSYRFLPNTAAFAEYELTDVAYETAEDRDSDVQSGHVGVTWEITENSEGTARAGYLTKDFADPSLKDFTTWTADVDLRHELTEAASVRVLGKRDVNEGKQPGMRYYTTTGVFADLTYRFLDRLAGTLEFSYSRDEFSDVQPGEADVRKDLTARAGIGAKYSYNSWLDFSLGYSYLNRDSNVDSLSATVNAVTFAVTAHR